MDLSEKLGWMAHQHKISTTIFFGWGKNGADLPRGNTLGFFN